VLFLVHRFLSPWWRRRQVPQKRRFLQEPHGVTTQNTQFFNVEYTFITRTKADVETELHRLFNICCRRIKWVTFRLRQPSSPRDRSQMHSGHSSAQDIGHCPSESCIAACFRILFRNSPELLRFLLIFPFMASLYRADVGIVTDIRSDLLDLNSQWLSSSVILRSCTICAVETVPLKNWRSFPSRASVVSQLLVSLCRRVVWHRSGPPPPTPSGSHRVNCFEVRTRRV
jgi:hypothetical protein